MFNYRTEFPTFDPATMPDIPFDWKDTSWKNDSCPSFAVTEDITVYIDFLDFQEREFPMSNRFSIHHHGEPIVGMNTWEEVLNYFKI